MDRIVTEGAVVSRCERGHFSRHSAYSHDLFHSGLKVGAQDKEITMVESHRNDYCNVEARDIYSPVVQLASEPPIRQSSYHAKD
jgi:hypothetical protein